MPDALLKLLVKDKPLYSGKVREKRETKLSRRNEVRADERQTGSGKPRGERLKIITGDKDLPARKVSS